MLTEFLVGIGVASALNALRKRGDTRVRHGEDIFGNRYRTVDGMCYRCGGSGLVNGTTCRKCGGSGRFHRRTWYS